MSKKNPRHKSSRGRPRQPVSARSETTTAAFSPDSDLLKIALAFVVIYAALQTAFWAVGYWGYVAPVLDATARLTSFLSNLTGVPASVSGNQVFLASRTLRIDPDCTAISPMLIYVALVCAYPTSMARRVVGALSGIVVLAVANLARLTMVAQLSAPLPDKSFFFVHDYLFKIVMVVVVIVLWGAYVASSEKTHEA